MAVNLNKGSAVENLNLTPLIDVVFLLLVFFLVVTRFAKEDRELDVVLPSASEAQPLIEQPKQVFVNIDSQGKFFVGGKILSAPEVLGVLREAVANSGTTPSVIIRADKRVALEAAVVVMDMCNRAGIFDYSLTTEGEN
jgi:biopolymer transport protein ExbD